MTNRKTTRRALVLSLLSLLLCCSMLVGTTFAWFTDSVQSGKNTIIAGNLDVELEYAKVENGQLTDWAPVAGKTDVFDPDALWEPGRVEVVYLKVSNLGTLALKYQLGVNVDSEITSTSVLGNELKLSDHLVFKTVEMPDALTTYTDREAVATAAGTEKGLKDYNGTTTALDAKGGANATDYVALIVYMPETVGNEANYRGTRPEITLGVNLYATQQTAESDSFNSNYDKDAWGEGFKVYDINDLQAAIDAGETNIDLMNDIDLTDSLVIPAAAATFDLRSAANTITINLNGKTIKGTVARDAEGNRIHVIVNNGNLKLVNGTVTSAGENGGSAIYNAEGATLTIEKLVVNGAPIVGTEKWPSYGINNYGVMTINGATINTYHGGVATCGNAVTIINDATVDVGQGTMTKQTSWALYVADNGELTVNDGVFKNTKDEQSKVYGGGYICATSTKATVIKGGVFEKTEGDNNGSGFYYNNQNLVIYGGTFDANPTAYAADGYKAVASNGNYIVVSEDAITTTDELVAAINAGKTEIKLAPGEYALRFTNNTSFNVDGITIKGIGEVKLAISSTEAWYGRVRGSGVTFENIHFTGAVGATGEATYNDCTFDSWAICASGNEKTYYNNCTINGCLNTSTDFSSDDVFVEDSEIVKAEYSGSMTMNFKNCQIGELIIWNANTNLNDCEVTTLDKSNVTTAIIRIDGIYETEKPIENAQPAPYKGELYQEGTNVVNYKDMVLTGDAHISIDNNASVAVENVKADVNGSVIVMKDYQPAIYIYGSEFTIGEGEYLIDASAIAGGVYQIFLVNVKVNGEYLTQETAAQYLNNVNWFQALQATNP